MEIGHMIPTVILLMNTVRRVSESEAIAVVSSELGDEVGQTVCMRAERDVGMSYLSWKIGDVWYNLGTSSDPYVPHVGIAQSNGEHPDAVQVKSSIRGELGPQDQVLFEAWASHRAWLYIDSLTWHAESDEWECHLGRVLRVASQFVDERCVLVWLWGTDRFAKPTQQAVASFRAGHWPS
jgi:hypothetical protein